MGIWFLNFISKKGIRQDNRIFGLDILRSLAIFFVCYSHGNEIIKPYISSEVLNLIHTDGVNLFFVLSGFLIGRILIKLYQSTSFDLQILYQFFMRRWFRTLPVYFFVLSVLIFYNQYFGEDYQGPIYYYYLFVQNFAQPHPAFFPEAWSLAVEEWFYLLFPLLLFFGKYISSTSSRHWLLISILTIIIFSFGYRYLLVQDFLDTPISIQEFYGKSLRKVVLTRFDSIMIGVLGAYVFLRHKKLWNYRPRLYFVIGVIIITLHENFQGMHYPVFWGTFSFLLLSIGFLFLLPLMNAMHSCNNKYVAWLITWVSIISYSMYLINRSLVTILIVFWPSGSMAVSLGMYLIYWLLLIILSSLLYLSVEHTFMQIRDRIFPKHPI